MEKVISITFAARTLLNGNNKPELAPGLTMKVNRGAQAIVTAELAPARVLQIADALKKALVGDSQGQDGVDDVIGGLVDWWKATIEREREDLAVVAATGATLLTGPERHP